MYYNHLVQWINRIKIGDQLDAECETDRCNILLDNNKCLENTIPSYEFSRF